MSNQRETTITRKLVDILEKMRHRWDIEVEVNAFTEGGDTLDALVIERGREPVGIEAKFATTTNATKLIKQAESRFVHELETEYRTVGNMLNNVMSIMYPDKFKRVAGRDIEKHLRATDNLHYKLVSRHGQFPQNGWAKGKVTDIANALYVGAMPTSHLEQAVDEMERSIDTAANLIADAVTEHPAIGSAIEEILHQAVFVTDEKISHQEMFAKDKNVKIHVQTLRMAALIITDAFVFQSALAGKEELGLGTVRSLSRLISPLTGGSVDYADVIKDWNTILNVNYAPIFKDARELVEALATDDSLVKPILTIVCEAAKNLVDTGLAQIHELAGMVFQKLITDRRYIKANYTLPTSATLLSALVLPKLPAGKLPKIADFACGTGALLSGVYQRLLMLYEQQGEKNGRDIHRQMLEENIGGADVMPNATHLTAALLASTNADVKIGKTRILTAPYGKQEESQQKNTAFAVGSLELLDDVSLLDTEAEQIGGESNRVVKLQQTFQHGDFDIVIQNPPFLKHSADGNTGVPKVVFQGTERPEEEKKALQNTLKLKETRVAHGTAGHGSYFVELADKKLKNGGTMGVILPATVLTSASMQKVRDMWATEYHDVYVITIAGAKSYESAFSADTSMAECIVVATKGVGDNTGHATFVSLTQLPQSMLEATEVANRILRGGDADTLRVGEDERGKQLNLPIRCKKAWGATRAKSTSLLQTAYKLADSVLSLPRYPTLFPVPIARVEDIAVVGFTEPTIKGKAGAFTVVKGYEKTSDGYPAIWHAKCEQQRTMVVFPDSHAKIRAGKEAQAQRILERISRVHYYLSPTFSATSAIAMFTEEPSIGTCIMTNVAFQEPRHEIAWTLWCNSTLGLVCHWLQCGKQQPGRGRLTHTTLKTMPTLDVRRLSSDALMNAEEIFERLKYKRMLPLNECAEDEVRHELDTELVTKVLGIQDASVLASMQTLREMLCAEPSIQGGKQSKCDLEKELRKLTKKGIVLPG